MTQLQNSSFLLAGAGAETYLAFVQEFPLRDFCAFEVFEHPSELAALERAIHMPILDAAATHGHDVLLDVLVWRAQPDFLDRLGHGAADTRRINHLAVQHTRDMVRRWQAKQPRAKNSIFLSGDLGPRGDGYRMETASSSEDAQRYHQVQIEALAEAGVDVVNCLTMTNANETIGIVRAARDVGLPCIVSATVETDGHTPEGQPLGEFVEQVERATGGAPLFYMVNCAHPIHLEPVLRQARARGDSWLTRFSGFRANASRKSHEELDESTELDRGHPEALTSQMAHLQAEFNLRLVGGCCGTDAEHLECMAAGISPDAVGSEHRLA